jgi:hypothetical protein
MIHEQHDADEQHADYGQTARAESGFLLHLDYLYFDLRASSTTVLARRKKTATSA